MRKNLTELFDSLEFTYLPENINGWIKITEMCPMQFEKITRNGNYAYVRYRWGILSLHITKSSEEIKSEIYRKDWVYGNEFDGVMDKESLEKWLKYFDYLIRKNNF